MQRKATMSNQENSEFAGSSPAMRTSFLPVAIPGSLAMSMLIQYDPALFRFGPAGSTQKPRVGYEATKKAHPRGPWVRCETESGHPHSPWPGTSSSKCVAGEIGLAPTKLIVFSQS